jgi:hypothetical protein
MKKEKMPKQPSGRRHTARVRARGIAPIAGGQGKKQTPSCDQLPWAHPNSRPPKSPNCPESSKGCVRGVGEVSLGILAQ